MCLNRTVQGFISDIDNFICMCLWLKYYMESSDMTLGPNEEVDQLNEGLESFKTGLRKLQDIKKIPVDANSYHFVN